MRKLSYSGSSATVEEFYINYDRASKFVFFYMNHHFARSLVYERSTKALNSHLYFLYDVHSQK